MGERSYTAAEYTAKVWVVRDGEGGKWTAWGGRWLGVGDRFRIGRGDIVDAASDGKGTEG